MFQFKVLRIRQKISFLAYVKLMTIPELVMSSIMKCHESALRYGRVIEQTK